MLERDVRCFDDATVYHLIQGQLAPADLAAADEHLDGCPACRSLVAASARGLGDGGGGAVTVDRGSTIDRFVVLDVLGGGAMGAVYEAYDPKLDRRVALKLLHPGAASPEHLLGEAQAMARLSHPNVVTVYEVGALDDRVFLAMELVTGDTLRAWAAAKPRGWREVRDVMAQAGEGLAAAHAKGLVHRDVKPENVIVGADGRVRVGDFGLARGPAASHDAGALIGTPAYMAPEQLRGEAADARADQFAFCATFWELLHGRRPFTAASAGALADAIAKGPPPALRGAPGFLDAALRRGLAAKRDDRFPTMSELLRALTIDRRRNHRGVAIAAAGALVSLAIVVPRPAAAPTCDGGRDRIGAVWGDDARARVRAGFSATGAAPAPAAAASVIAALDTWTARWAAAHAETCRATRVRGEQSEHLLELRMRCLDRRRTDLAALVERLGAADVEAVARGAAAVGELGAIDECAAVEALSTVEPPPRGPEAAARLATIERGLAESRAALATGHPARAAEIAVPLVAAAEALGHRPTLAEARLARAEALRSAGEAAGSEAAAFDALWAAEAGRDDTTAARAWITLMGTAGERRDLTAAAHRSRHAAAAIARLGDPPLYAAKLANGEGLVEMSLGHLDAAGRALERALDLRRRALGDGDLEVARSHVALGDLARLRGDLAAAEDHHRRALAVDRAALGEGHPDVARDLHNIAGVLRLGGKLAAAEATYREALAIKRAALGDAHVEVGLTENSLGLVALEQGRLDDAAARFSTALAIFSAKDHADRALALQNLGLVALARGDAPVALSRFTEALPLYVAELGESHERVVRLRASIAEAERALAAAPPSAPRPQTSAPPTARPRAEGAYGSGQAWDRP
jgi:tetratricopeptide (TPR) repeat protein